LCTKLKNLCQPLDSELLLYIKLPPKKKEGERERQQKTNFPDIQPYTFVPGKKSQGHLFMLLESGFAKATPTQGRMTQNAGRYCRYDYSSLYLSNIGARSARLIQDENLVNF